jgi:lysyl-tRNA synthetase class 2
MHEESTIIRQRREKIRTLREAGIEPFPNTFKPQHTIAGVLTACGGSSKEDLEALDETFSLAKPRSFIFRTKVAAYRVTFSVRK